MYLIPVANGFTYSESWFEHISCNLCISSLTTYLKTYIRHCHIFIGLSGISFQISPGILKGIAYLIQGSKLRKPILLIVWGLQRSGSSTYFCLGQSFESLNLISFVNQLVLMINR